MNRPWWILALGIGMIILAIGNFRSERKKQLAYRNAESWPVARAEVIEWDVRRRTLNGHEFFLAGFKYRYVVNRIEHLSDRYNYQSYETFDTNAEASEFLAAHYSVGRSFDVYYNPDENAVSIVNPETVATEGSGPLMTWGFAVFFSVAGGFLILMFASSDGTP